MAGPGGAVWVVPDEGRAQGRRLERARTHDAGTRVWTWSELLQRVGAPGLPGRQLSAVGQRLVVREALARARWSGASEAEIEAVEVLLHACRAGEVTPEILEGTGRALGEVRGAALLRAGKVLRAFDEILGARGLTTEPDLWASARAALAAGWPEPLLGIASLTVEIDPPRSPRERAVLLALTGRAELEGVRVEVRLQGTGSPLLDAASEPTFAAFEVRTDLSPLSLVKVLPEPERPFSALLERIGVSEARPVAIPGLALWSARSERDEELEVARRCREAVEAGTPPERCAVVCLEPTRLDRIAEALEAAGLPVDRRCPVRLAPTAAGRVGLAMARLAGEDLPAELVGWLATHPLLPGVSRRAPAGTVALLRQAGVRDDALGATGGQGAYAARLSALAAVLSTRGATERAAAVVEAESVCAELGRQARRIPSRATLAAHLDAWVKGLESLGFWDGKSSLSPFGEESAALEAWRGLVRDARADLKALGTGGPVLDRRAFARLWEAAAGDCWVCPGPRDPGGVAVVGPAQLPGTGWTWIAVPGLAEGRVRLHDRARPWLSEDDRAAVNRRVERDALPWSVGAGPARTSVEAADVLWRLGVALGAADGASLSLAREDGSGAELLADPFLVSVSRAAGSSVEALPGTPALPVIRCASEGELRVRLALEATVTPALRAEAPDPLARACLARLDGEPWLAAARALGAVERDRLASFATAEGAAPGPFTGLVQAEDLREALAHTFAFGPEAPLSASTLGRFAACGFQGFVRTGLRVEVEEGAGEELDGRGKGVLFHAVLERLFPRLDAAGLLGRPAREVPEALIASAVDEGARAVAERMAVGHPKVWALARERATWMVRRLLDAPHRGLPFVGAEPVETEASFGNRRAAAEWARVQLPAAFSGERDISLTGSIDRIDAGAAGCGVLDYKLSKSARQAREEALVTDFQLALYLYALRARGERRPLQAGWLALRKAEFVPFEAPVPLDALLATDAVSREEAAAEGRPNLANAVHAVVARARTGQFAVRPVSCEFCPYGAICRISDRVLPEDRS